MACQVALVIPEMPASPDVRSWVPLFSGFSGLSLHACSVMVGCMCMCVGSICDWRKILYACLPRFGESEVIGLERSGVQASVSVRVCLACLCHVSRFAVHQTWPIRCRCGEVWCLFGLNGHGDVVCLLSMPGMSLFIIFWTRRGDKGKQRLHCCLLDVHVLQDALRVRCNERVHSYTVSACSEICLFAWLCGCK